MISHIVAKLNQMRKGEKGAVLVFIGICLLPALLMMGLAIDSSVGLGQKRKLQAAVDIAAKAAASKGTGDIPTITSTVQNVFAANTMGMSNISGPNVNVDAANKSVTVSASITVPNTFMKVGGIANSSYNALATLPLASQNVAEVAIVFEVSQRFASRYYHRNICSALIDFVNSLPENVMVSITPIATEFVLDAATTMKDKLFPHLSMTTNDESAQPAFFPLSPTYSWSEANYNSIENPFYYAGSFGDYPSDPGVLTSFEPPATCPGGYPSCAPKMWPSSCSYKKTSCSQVYSYISNRAYPILPLTQNKAAVVNYLNDLRSFNAQADGFFPSLISWGWRTIDPSWKDFWKTNSEASSNQRATGTYPKPYGNVKKSMILIFNDQEYWDDFAPNTYAYYINKCGDSNNVVNGVNHWWMSGYGLVPVPTDRINYVEDITCENKWYKTTDKSLGLNLSDSSNYKATANTSSYRTAILNEVHDKFFRICNNIKANNVDIYLLSDSHTSNMAPCCNTSGNAYTIGNYSSSISNALNSVKAKIEAKMG